MTGWRVLRVALMHVDERKMSPKALAYVRRSACTAPSRSTDVGRGCRSPGCSSRLAHSRKCRACSELLLPPARHSASRRAPCVYESKALQLTLVRKAAGSASQSPAHSKARTSSPRSERKRRHGSHEEADGGMHARCPPDGKSLIGRFTYHKHVHLTHCAQHIVIGLAHYTLNSARVVLSVPTLCLSTQSCTSPGPANKLHTINGLPLALGRCCRTGCYSRRCAALSALTFGFALRLARLKTADELVGSSTLMLA